MPSRIDNVAEPNILFVFLDGVGLGPASPSNPLSKRGAYPSLEMLAGAHPWTDGAEAMADKGQVFRPIDARLGVEGLPQSGTGQASLFTGVNCAEIAGRHFGPFPHSSSRPVLQEHNIYITLQREVSLSLDSLAFANAYPDRFFSYVKTTNRWTVTTLCCDYAGVRLHGEDDLREGDAVAANITGEGWPGRPVPVVTDDVAAANLARLSARHAFTLFEYYLTDKAGHGRPGADPSAVLASLDRFFGALLSELPARTLLLVTSDHGNLEDLSTRGHTLNSVPLIARGPNASHFTEARSIMDVTPLIVDYFLKHL